MDSKKFIKFNVKRYQRGDFQEFCVGDEVHSINGRSTHIIESFKIMQRQLKRGVYSGVDEVWVTYTGNEGGNWLCELNLGPVPERTEPEPIKKENLSLTIKFETQEAKDKFLNIVDDVLGINVQSTKQCYDKYGTGLIYQNVNNKLTIKEEK